ncbi:glycerophosphodiester phosphodiesterase family protein [Aerococcaceae bacterium zg-BR22]|uniref:glycerophosphodiester phosphodiesterase family protein n=1 Tax=Aerococcaceae bacterium zg-1292 TaxID=2774330 RepID=UPI004064A737|nr:glycerophosphodiester phosphodiesterase family protein [Aerococcaceae bacterium zg-BR22]
MNNLRQLRMQKGTLIAVHRGLNGGNILQNTLKAYLNAVRHGGDLIELDLVRSTDGIFFAFHDGQEKIVFQKDLDIRKLSSKEIRELTCYNSLGEPINQKIETLDEVLETVADYTFINIDRSWFYWDTLLEKLKQSKGIDKCLLKSPVSDELLMQLQDSQLEIMYMPIVKDIDDLEKVLSFENINTVALELIFETLESPLLQKEAIDSLHEKGYLLWANALRLNDTTILAAELDDDAAIEDDGKTWLKLIDLGFDIIQTDWPAFLEQTLKNKRIRGKYNV